MDVSYFVDLVQDYGYFAIFLFNWVMLLGIPLPAEAAAMLGGAVTENRSFYPPFAFGCLYAGLITSNLFTYFIGRLLAESILVRLERPKFKNNARRFREAFDKYGGFAISFSFFLPGFRMIMPYVMGANRYPVPRYLLYAGTASLVWSFLYFQIGRTFPAMYKELLPELQQYLIALSVLTAIIALAVFCIRRTLRPR